MSARVRDPRARSVQVTAVARAWLFNLSLTRAAWVFGGGPETLVVRRKTAADTESWRDFPPLADHFLRVISAAVELRRPPVWMAAGALMVGDDFASNLSDLSEVLRLNDLSFGVTQAIDTLRLVLNAETQVGFEELQVVIRDGHYRRRFNTTPMTPFRVGRISQARIIQPQDAREHNRRWSIAAHGANADILRLPLRRFGIMHQRAWDEDRLLDGWIALESLFKRTNETRGAADAIARRSGKFLEMDRDALRAHRRRVDRARRARDVVVHGHWDYADPTIHEACETITGLLSNSLLRLTGEATKVDLLSL